jgi:hypothetical protein
MQADQLRAHRIGDVEKALRGHIDDKRVDAIGARLIAANDHIGAAHIGAGLASKLETANGRHHLASLFDVGDNALATAALNLGAISVHTALDLCAAAILIASDCAIRAPDKKEYAMGDLIDHEKAQDLSDPFRFWLKMAKEHYEELRGWRNPQTHRVVLKGYSAVEPTNGISGVSVQVYDAKEKLLGTAREMVGRFADFGEERFLGLCFALQNMPDASST